MMQPLHLYLIVALLLALVVARLQDNANGR